MFRYYRAFLVCFALFAALSGEAFYIRLHGIVTELFSGDGLKGVQVRMVKDGIERETVITKGNGEYEFMLDRGYTYLIWFYKDGWVTKHVKIDATEVPPIPDVPFYDMDLQMTLFTWVDGVDLSVFDQPLGLAEYVHSTRNLNWNVDYTERLRPLVVQAMDAYEKRLKNYAPKAKPVAPINGSNTP